MQFQRLSPCGAPGLHRVVRRIAAWRDYAIARRESQTLVLFGLVAALTLSAVACGGDEPLAPGGTEITERAERQATVVARCSRSNRRNRRRQAEAEQQAAPEQAAEAEARQQAQQAQQQQAESEAPGDVEDDSTDTITLDETVIEAIVARLAEHREGVAVERSAIGDPDAPVVIVEYGDFQ